MIAFASVFRRIRPLSRVYYGLLGAYTILIVLVVLLRDILEPASSAMACLINFLPLWFIPALPLALLNAVVNRRSRWYLLVPLIPVMIAGLLYWRWFVPPAMRGYGEIAHQGETLSILTHNISSKTYDFQNTIQFLQSLNADIVFLQEIHLNTPGMDQIPEAFQATHPYIVVQNDEDELRANMILSRYPILGSEDLSDLKSQYARLCVSGIPVDVYNISLDTPITGVPRLGNPLSFILPYDPQARNAQIEALLQRLNTQTDPLILAGDFNLSDQSAYYRRIAARFIDSYAEVGSGPGFTYPSSTTFRIPIPQFLPPLLRIDYIWHNNAFAPISADLHAGVQSDHLAVFANLVWNTSAVPSSCDASTP
ncbi:MAG: endonuclease/exonuclease/phosphatase family protein [Anaerolineae bacterium]